MKLFIQVKNHLNVKFVVKDLIKNLTWKHMGEYTQIKLLNSSLPCAKFAEKSLKLIKFTRFMKEFISYRRKTFQMKNNLNVKHVEHLSSSKNTWRNMKESIPMKILSHVNFVAKISIDLPISEHTKKFMHMTKNTNVKLV